MIVVYRLYTECGGPPDCGAGLGSPKIKQKKCIHILFFDTFKLREIKDWRVYECKMSLSQKCLELKKIKYKLITQRL